MTAGRPSCNLRRDSVEHVARHAKSCIRHGRGLISIVIRENGSFRSYRRGCVPEHEELWVIGTYNARVSESTLAEDLSLRLAELGT